MNNKGNIKEVPSTSLDVREDLVRRLLSVVPEAETDGKIDWDKLKQELKGEIEESNERYDFTWNGKKDSLRLAQKPTTATLKPNKDKSKNWDTTKNIYIEGDNLEVLKILQKSYSNKIKVIYIDPPYNTGKDFVYKDNFHKPLDNYLVQTSQVDVEGNKITANTETSGRFHTDWLNMMYPRLKISRNLLTEDGMIFISINDSEVSNLIKICDEIFGESNRVADLIWANKEGGGSSDSLNFRIKHEHILVYAKDISLIEISGVSISNKERYKNKDEYVSTRGKYYLQKLGMGSIQYSETLDYPIKTPDGGYIMPSDNNGGKRAVWRWSKEKLEWGIENGYIIFRKDRNNIWTIYTKQYLNADNDGNIVKRTQRPMGIIEEFSSTQASKEMANMGLSGYFDYPKPTKLIQWLIERIDNEDSYFVLDFFSGSASTAETVIRQNLKDGGNRKFIMVQLPEKLGENTIAYKDGYRTIPEIARERINRVGEKIEKENTLFSSNLDAGFKVFELNESNIKKWNTDPSNLEEQISIMDNNFEEGSTPLDVVYEVMLKQGLELTYRITEDILGDMVIYNIEYGAMFVVLGEEIDESISNYLNNEKIDESVVIFQDQKFKDDSTKLNIIESLNANGIKYENIFSI